jgi:hypothetical protein
MYMRENTNHDGNAAFTMETGRSYAAERPARFMESTEINKQLHNVKTLDRETKLPYT